MNSGGCEQNLFCEYFLTVEFVFCSVCQLPSIYLYSNRDCCSIHCCNTHRRLITIKEAIFSKQPTVFSPLFFCPSTHNNNYHLPSRSLPTPKIIHPKRTDRQTESRLHTRTYVPTTTITSSRLRLFYTINCEQPSLIF